MNLKTEKYIKQINEWPQEGKHILAQYDDEGVVVYQAYRPAIGLYAAKNNYFGGEFSFTRMSWVKPNFLWMMYRSGWGTKPGQEVVLAIRLYREFFDEILKQAFPSSNTLQIPESEWKEKIANTNVRLQWDPDHGPKGNPVKRRAIQLGLRGDMLAPFKGEGIISIDDISEFVAEQRCLVDKDLIENLEMPEECVYPVAEEVKRTLQM